MATIGQVQRKADGSFTGTLATLTITTPITIVPIRNKKSETAPDYRVIRTLSFTRVKCLIPMLPHCARAAPRIGAILWVGYGPRHFPLQRLTHVRRYGIPALHAGLSQEEEKRT
jgi:hypothetical protein